jgi:hypothetical protein
MRAEARRAAATVPSTSDQKLDAQLLLALPDVKLVCCGVAEGEKSTSGASV